MGMPDIEAKLRAYAHELSGGMAQRVLIAMALVNTPDLLVADEPTTALDTTVQAQILDLLAGVTRRTAIILISHDVNVVAAVCDRMIVMYRGEVVEEGRTEEICGRPGHPYTKALIKAGHPIPVRGRDESVGELFQKLGADAAEGGCQYRSRCPEAFAPCHAHPDLELVEGRRVRCFAATATLTSSPESIPSSREAPARFSSSE
jgi:oligopeptide/dipeptide ABC transporter ATP-binding protein